MTPAYGLRGRGALTAEPEEKLAAYLGMVPQLGSIGEQDVATTTSGREDDRLAPGWRHPKRHLARSAESWTPAQLATS